MAPIEKLLDAYVFLWCHTAAASPAISGLGRITILSRCSSNAKVSVSFETTTTLFTSFRLLIYEKDRTPAVTAATGVLVTN